MSNSSVGRTTPARRAKLTAIRDMSSPVASSPSTRRSRASDVSSPVKSVNDPVDPDAVSEVSQSPPSVMASPRLRPRLKIAQYEDNDDTPSTPLPAVSPRRPPTREARSPATPRRSVTLMPPPPSTPEPSSLRGTRQSPKSPAVNKKKKFHHTEDSADDTSLYLALKSGKVAPQVLVDEWIEHYVLDKDTAIVELIGFFVAASGCRGVITLAMYESLSVADLIKQMTLEFDEDTSDYPLVAGGAVWRRFRVALVDFIQVLIRQCQYNIIYDQIMIDRLVSFLTGLTDSQVRAFRHTSCVVMMKLMTSLMDVALSVTCQRDTAQRQYEVERGKGADKRADERLEALLAKREELDENIQEIKNILIFIFKGVFVHRYRDIHSDIRVVCMQELGLWMHRYPSMFLDDSYLKFIGWMLSDKVGEVRAACLKCLLPLYEDPGLIPATQLFTARFKTRMVDMVLDRDTEVAVLAVKVLSALIKNNTTLLLENKDCELIYELVFSSNRTLAHASGHFLSFKLFNSDVMSLSMTSPRRGKRASSNRVFIRDLVSFLNESELHEHAAYLVDSLWSVTPLLQDWNAMLQELSEDADKSIGEVPLTPSEEVSLVDILTCCVKQASTGMGPVGRQAPGSKASKEDDRLDGGHVGGGKKLIEERNRLTLALIPALPHLLARFCENVGILMNLLQIPNYMNLDLYVANRQEKHLDMLLKYLKASVLKHADPDILLSCSRVYETMCQEDALVATKCRQSRDTLLDDLVETFRENFQLFTQSAQKDDDEYERVAFIILNCLKRVYAFYACHDLTYFDMWPSLMSLCRSPVDTVSEPLVTKGMGCAALALMWAYDRVRKHPDDPTEVKALRSEIFDYMHLCAGLLDHASHLISHEAYISLSDSLVLFSRPSLHFINLESLAFRADESLIDDLLLFLKKRVFSSKEHDSTITRTSADTTDRREHQDGSIEALHTRRTYLACFCKLVIYRVIPMRHVALVYRHYLDWFNDFGDIMKASLTKLRALNMVQAGQMVGHALHLGYTDLEETRGIPVDSTSTLLVSLKELARRLSLCFGLDASRIRESILALHTQCIRVVSERHRMEEIPAHQPPSNIAFLDLLAEFAHKLLKQDKVSMAEYLRRVFRGATQDDSWSCLHRLLATLDPTFYKSSLPRDPASATSGKASSLKKTRKPAAFKKSVHYQSDSDEEEKSASKRRKIATTPQHNVDLDLENEDVTGMEDSVTSLRHQPRLGQHHVTSILEEEEEDQENKEPRRSMESVKEGKRITTPQFTSTAVKSMLTSPSPLASSRTLVSRSLRLTTPTGTPKPPLKKIISEADQVIAEESEEEMEEESPEIDEVSPDPPAVTDSPKTRSVYRDSKTASRSATRRSSRGEEKTASRFATRRSSRGEENKIGGGSSSPTSRATGRSGDRTPKSMTKSRVQNQENAPPSSPSVRSRNTRSSLSTDWTNSQSPEVVFRKSSVVLTPVKRALLSPDHSENEEEETVAKASPKRKLRGPSPDQSEDEEEETVAKASSRRKLRGPSPDQSEDEEEQMVAKASSRRKLRGPLAPSPLTESNQRSGKSSRTRDRR